MATNPQDSTQGTGEQTNASETTQNTAGGGKKDAEVTPTNDATTPATPNTTAAPAARTAMKAAARPNTTAKFKVLAALPKMKAAAPAETPDPTVPDPTTAYATASDWSDLTQGKAIGLLHCECMLPLRSQEFITEARCYLTS